MLLATSSSMYSSMLTSQVVRPNPVFRRLQIPLALRTVLHDARFTDPFRDVHLRAHALDAHAGRIRAHGDTAETTQHRRRASTGVHRVRRSEIHRARRREREGARASSRARVTSARRCLARASPRRAHSCPNRRRRLRVSDLYVSDTRGRGFRVFE